MSMTSYDIKYSTKKTDCVEVAFDEMDTWIDHGFSVGAATCYANAAYALCTGSSWQEIQDNGGADCTDW
ncbi:hypothetical protein [Lacinutrix sp. MedPE-SW]|uniref:hypothetical protein n=1 Tax=Lacinutrix sp. MedPE-SW TaxID=1860087 RepID=UPI0025C213A7|nr:hypothetical protein [Lacinutrix sp. MedPE-SW]